MGIRCRFDHNVAGLGANNKTSKEADDSDPETISIATDTRDDETPWQRMVRTSDASPRMKRHKGVVNLEFKITVINCSIREGESTSLFKNNLTYRHCQHC